MTNVYDREYIEESALCLAEAFDYAANECQMDIEMFMEMFEVSGYERRFEEKDPAVVLGLSGTELVCRTLQASGLYLNFPPPQKIYGECSVQYWCGYFLVYLSFYAAKSIKSILSDISIDEFSEYVPALVRADEETRRSTLTGILSYVEAPVRLQEIRKECGYSQRELAQISGVNLRTLQQYEVRAKDINRAASQTILALARVLGCRIEDLMEF